MKLIPEKTAETLVRNLNRQMLVAKKNSPHIFFVGGVAGVIGTTVLACRATLKMDKTLGVIHDDIEVVKLMKSDAESKTSKYTEKEYARDLTYVYGKSALYFVRLYGPSVILGAASITALTGSHIQLTRRNSALTMTVAAISQAYEEYRQRVRDAVGTEQEIEIYRGEKEHEIENEDGKKEIIHSIDPNLSLYARLFEESNPNWVKNAEMNRLFIKCQQNYANHQLRTRGHIFLNEVYDSLNLERSKAGAVVGWVLDGKGDGYVDFGAHEYLPGGVRMGEPNIVLDFNVDGVVYDKI